MTGGLTRALDRVGLRLRRPVVVRAPEATARTGRRRRQALAAVTSGLVAFAALHAGLAAVAERSAFISDPLFADKESRLCAAEGAAPAGAPVVLALGTSRTLNGLDAGSAERTARAAVFNFGVPGTGPATHAVYYRRLRAAGHRPQLLLLEVLPSSLTAMPGGPAEAHYVTPDRFTRAETGLLVSRYGFPSAFQDRRAPAGEWSPWQTHGFKLLARVAPDALPWQRRFDAGRIGDARGWFPLAGNVGQDQQSVARELDRYRHALADWRPSPVAALALRDVLELCRHDGTAVALVLMPESAAFRGLMSPAAQERLTALLADLAAGFDCRVIDAREWVPDGHFSDGHHLLASGGAVFTNRLTAEVILPFLRAKPAGGR